MKTHLKRAHSNELNSYDLLFAVTQDAVNTQLRYMFDFGFIDSEVSIGKIEEDGFEISGVLNAPELHFDANSVSQANMVVSFASGTFKTYQGFGRKAVEKSYPCEGWAIGMAVDLKEASIENNKNSSMDEAKTTMSTKGFLDTAVFSVRHIFLDFQNVNMSSFDDSKLVIKISEGEGSNLEQLKSQLKVALSTYFGEIKNSDNPYVLGYSVVNKETPQSDLAKVLFAPTGVAYSTHTNSSHPGKSTLNFLMMTDGEPVSLDKRDVIISGDVVETSGTDGIAAIRKSTFEEKYLSVIWAAITEKLRPVDPKTLKIAVARYDKNEIIDRYKTTPSGAKQFAFSSDIQTYADIGSFRKIHYINRQSINMSLLAGSDYIQFSGKGNLFTEVLFKQFTGTWDPINGKGEMYMGQFWSIINSELSVTVKMSAGKDGKIAIDSKVDFKKGDYDKGHSGLYGEVSNLLADLGIGDHIENNLQDFNTTITKRLQEAIGTINGSFETIKDRIIMPGAKEFFFKNIQLTPEGNVRLNTTYKLANQ